MSLIGCDDILETRDYEKMASNVLPFDSVLSNLGHVWDISNYARILLCLEGMMIYPSWALKEDGMKILVVKDLKRPILKGCFNR